MGEQERRRGVEREREREREGDYKAQCHTIEHVGSSLQQLSTHIPKLLHYSGGLTFDNVAPVSSLSSERITPHAAPPIVGGVNQITGIVSLAGERMNLNQVHLHVSVVWQFFSGTHTSKVTSIHFSMIHPHILTHQVQAHGTKLDTLSIMYI